jgi:hypothetical protein
MPKNKGKSRAELGDDIEIDHTTELNLEEKKFRDASLFSYAY